MQEGRTSRQSDRSITVSGVIAAWPAVALLIAVKLLPGILEHRASAARSLAADRGSDAPGLPGLTAVPGPQASPAARQTRRSRRVDSSASGGTVSAEIVALEQAARAVRDDLYRDGRPLTREALATRLRAAGYPVRNARLTSILAALRAEAASAASCGLLCGHSSCWPGERG